ncbi:MAG: site-specific integrase [Planctomycetes bacterium]|nr:site-specific integrase [Planctomycetota bacterium]
MATERVGVYRKWHGPVPVDGSGRPLPRSQWIDKRPCAWSVRWFGAEGRRYSRSFDTRKEAERFAETKQQDVRKGNADPPKRITLREFYNEHRKLMKPILAHSTLHMQMTTLSLLAQAVGWDREIKRIARRDIETFRAQRAAETGNAPATINKEIRSLRRVFELAIGRGYLPQGGNPCVGLPMMKVGRKRIPYCSPKEFHEILARAPGILWQTLVVVLYTAGLRLREAMNLTWADIDFARGELHVTRRDAAGFVQAWSPKDHECRTIPVPDQAIDLLTRLQAVAPEKCPYVFMEQGRWDYYRQRVLDGTWKKGKPDLMNNWLRRFKTLCRKAGVRRFTIHDLRRSCITNWARQLPIHVTQKLAGHGDIHTTQMYYLSVQDEDVVKAKSVQAQLVGQLPEATDPKLTQTAQKRDFPKRKVFPPVAQPPE